MDTKITKVIALNILLISLALYLSGCVNPIITPEVSPFSPTITITPSLPGATATIPATETQLPPYPKSAENFVKKPSISGAEARKIIVEKGAGEDLKALENWYKSEGIIGSGKSNFVVPVVYQEGGNFNWNLMIKKGNGNFLKFTITSGKEADQLVRAMGMITYLGEKPSFEVSELKDPAGMENLTQQVIWDKSGWSVVGAFRGETLIGWFNADKNMWVVEQNPQVEVTPTPEYEPIHSSLEIEGNVDGVPVKVTFAIGEDIYQRSEIPIDKWVINPKAEEVLYPETVQDMIAKVILEAHYHAWQSDNYPGRKGISFDEYTRKLKNGEDMSYEIAAAIPGSFLETTIEKVDPLKPLTFVLVNRPGGFSFGNSARDISLFNYVGDNGALRTELYTSLNYMSTIYGTDFTKDNQLYSVETMLELASSLHFLSFDIEYQKPTVGTIDFNIYSSKIMEERPELRSGDLFILNPEVSEFADGVTPLLVERK